MHEEQKGLYLCTVCYEEVEKTRSLECNHKFCEDCFRGYLESQVSSGPDSVYSTCPQQKCGLIVPIKMFKQLCTDESFKKYQKYFKKSFIEMNKRTKWCPAPSCQYAVEYPSMMQTDIFCPCGNDFCFKCLKKAHRPIHCELLAKWLDNINHNDCTEIWLKLNTKACPKCKVQI